MLFNLKPKLSKSFFHFSLTSLLPFIFWFLEIKCGKWQNLSFGWNRHGFSQFIVSNHLILYFPRSLLKHLISAIPKTSVPIYFSKMKNQHFLFRHFKSFLISSHFQFWFWSIFHFFLDFWFLTPFVISYLNKVGYSKIGLEQNSIPDKCFVAAYFELWKVVFLA